MTKEEKLRAAAKLVEDAWTEIIPDRRPITVAEEEYFDEVELTASRILSDLERMSTFLSDAELA